MNLVIDINNFQGSISGFTQIPRLVAMSLYTILLFGDQLASKSPILRKLYALSISRPNLKAFLEAATDVLQCQLDYLLPCERDAYGDFRDILQLVHHYESSAHLNEAVGTVLTTIIQIADLLL
jgi:hypothetical protein